MTDHPAGATSGTVTCTAEMVEVGLTATDLDRATCDRSASSGILSGTGSRSLRILLPSCIDPIAATQNGIRESGFPHSRRGPRFSFSASTTTRATTGRLR